MSKARLGVLAGVLSALLIVVAVSCRKETTGPGATTQTTGTYAKAPIPPDWIETEVDVFAGMNGVTLPPNTSHDPNNPLRGRIVWNLWIGDSWKMWDYLAQHGFGTADLIKTVDSRRHDTRFAEIGIINQPGFMTSAKPDQYGLYIDVANPNDPAGANFDKQVDTHTYGRSTGVIGLRMYDNPEFTGTAKQAWMDEIAKTGGYAKRFYEDPSYYNDPKLVRPYVVGMACSLCHVSFDPVRPPADVNNPKWENMNDYIGAQYFNVAEFFVPRRVQNGKFLPQEEESFIWQLIHSSPSGSLDTSFIATDYLNNPGTMNGVFNVTQRLSRAANGTKTNPGKYDPMVEYMTGGALDLMWLEGLDNGTQKIPRVLKQGDDSVGFEGALSRVYVNIGHAWPQWQQHFRPLVGGPFLKNPSLASQSPVTVREMQVNSPSWNWSEARSRALALYFIQYAKPLLLKDAPGGAAYLTADPKVLDRGKVVFAENCAACHSSRQPDFDPFVNNQITDQAKNWFRTEVMKPDFFTDNFLSDERRHPVTQIGTNSNRAAATNATRNHIWDNFSSETYKTLPKIGSFDVDNPPDIGKATVNIPLPGEEAGPGYYRPPSLISLWSSAPYLHNNAVGIDPTAPPLRGKVDTKARMDAFQDGIEKMLWIKPRGTLVWRTTKTSTINLPKSYLDKPLQDVLDLAAKLHPELYDKARDAYIIGPIPKGTPINLLSNTNLDPGLDLAAKRIALFGALIDTVIKIKADKLSDAAALQLMQQKVVPKFLALNKCPDFYEDKGHEFGKALPVEDKRALIELLKTF